MITKGFTPTTGQPDGALGPNLALMDLILGWYQASGGLFSAESRFDNKAYVPAGWSGNNALYLNVVAPYCRGCHIADAPNLGSASPAPLDFASFANFQANKAKINATVCNRNTAITMPHAQRVYHRFWASGASAVLAFDQGFANCKMRPL